MLNCLTDFAENTWLKHIVGETAMSPPTDWYVALFSSDPGESGNLSVELSGNGYARLNHNDWKAASDRRIANNGVVQPFTASGGDWVQATHWGLVDSPTTGAGHLWVRGELAAPVTVANGNTYSFNDGELAVIFDTYLIHFNNGGAYEIQALDTVIGDTSGASAEVVDVTVLSGTWAEGTAAGFLVLTGITGTFEAESISVGAQSGCAVIDGEYIGVWGDYLVHQMLDFTFGNGSFDPGVLWVGYSTANPGDDGAGLAEPSGNNYGRAQAGDWNPVADGVTWNTGQINFPTPTGAWGDLTHAFITDSQTGGNLYLYGRLLHRQSPGNGASVYFPGGQLVIGLERTSLYTP